MSFDTNLKKIDHRNWANIKAKWMNYLPSFEYPGQSPELELSEFYGLDNIAVQTNKSPGEYRQDVISLRTEIFREGIYLFHKASHVCNAGLIHVDNGMTTWSISSAYHSSFFSLKSIFCLLGVSFPRISSIGGKCLMIDCFPKEEELSSNQRKKGIQPKIELKFVVFPPLAHHQYWKILHRLLNVSSVNCWDQRDIEFMLKFNETDYAFQRNLLHYKNNYWQIPEELFNAVSIPSFGRFDTLEEKLIEISQTKNDFSFCLAYITLRMAFLLIQEIAEEAPILKDEFELIKKCLSFSTNERMRQSLSLI